MIKVGTLTIHTGYNEGAVLQSLALHRAISEITGSPSVEIVDHRYPNRLSKGYGPANDDRKKAIQNYYDNRSPVSPVRIVSNSHREAFDYINRHYDAVVVGSDEVWKVNRVPRLRGLIRLQTDPMAPAFPNVYWPDKSVTARKISYAATVGAKTNWSALTGSMRRQMVEILNGFHAIGVRDTRTQAFLDWLDPSLRPKVTWTPDPTFLVDLTAEVDEGALRTKLADFGVDFTRPRVLMIAQPHPLYADLVKLLKQQGFQVVTASDVNDYGDVDLTHADLDPLEWAAAFKHFDLCVSERMHGAIFSLRNGCRLICVDRRDSAMDMPTKNAELCSRLGIEDRYVSVRDAQAPEKLAALVADAMNDSHLSQIDAKIASFCEIGRAFLTSALLDLKRQ